MALIKCEDCGKEVSSMAPACPQCGRPMNIPGQQDPTTIQATSKQYKGRMLIGAIMCGIGFPLTFLGEENMAIGLTGAFLCFAGLALFVGARIGAWWHHR